MKCGWKEEKHWYQRVQILSDHCTILSNATSKHSCLVKLFLQLIPEPGSYFQLGFYRCFYVSLPSNPSNNLPVAKLTNNVKSSHSAKARLAPLENRCIENIGMIATCLTCTNHFLTVAPVKCCAQTSHVWSDSQVCLDNDDDDISLAKHSHGVTREERREVHVSTETAVIYFASLAACSLFMKHREIRSVRHLRIKKEKTKSYNGNNPTFFSLFVSYSYWRLSVAWEVNCPGQKPGKHKFLSGMSSTLHKFCL